MRPILVRFVLTCTRYGEQETACCAAQPELRVDFTTSPNYYSEVQFDHYAEDGHGEFLHSQVASNKSRASLGEAFVNANSMQRNCGDSVGV